MRKRCNELERIYVYKRVKKHAFEIRTKELVTGLLNRKQHICAQPKASAG
jgi:hypothetical protein